MVTFWKNADKSGTTLRSLFCLFLSCRFTHVLHRFYFTLRFALLFSYGLGILLLLYTCVRNASPFNHGHFGLKQTL